MTILRENHTIDITKGLTIFDEKVKEKLPPSKLEMLPEANLEADVAVEAEGGA